MLCVLLCNDIDDSDIAPCIMTGGRSRYDLDIFNMTGRDLFQRLCPTEHARLTVYIHHKPRTSTERYFALSIHADRRRILQNIDSRSSACQHIRRGLDHLLVQFIDDLFLLRHDFHLGKPDFKRFHRNRTQVDYFRR